MTLTEIATAIITAEIQNGVRSSWLHELKEETKEGIISTAIEMAKEIEKRTNSMKMEDSPGKDIMPPTMKEIFTKSGFFEGINIEKSSDVKKKEIEEEETKIDSKEMELMLQILEEEVILLKKIICVFLSRMFPTTKSTIISESLIDRTNINRLGIRNENKVIHIIDNFK